MKTRQLSASGIIAGGLALLGGFTFGCEARVHALGTSQQELGTVYPPNPAACPESPTQAMLSYDSGGALSASSVCSDVPAGTTCAYELRDSDGGYSGWAEYVCGCSVEGHWQNIGTHIEGWACPDQAPVEGAACDPAQLECPYYPNQFAVCVQGAWQIETGPRTQCDLP